MNLKLIDSKNNWFITNFMLDNQLKTNYNILRWVVLNGC